MKKPRLILVGAGPGDPELITLAGIKALEQADVILYDALISLELLEYAKTDCKLVFVGKRSGQHHYSQEEINQLIVLYATRYGTVVRLKGGDPYIFGRGHEEKEYAEKRDIVVEVVPGISSAIAGPGNVGISITQKNVSDSFWVITGTCRSGKISNDLLLAAQSSATIIILMGMANLKDIIKVFRQQRGELEYAAIVQRATLPEKTFIKSTLANLEEEVIASRISTPAIIVIGKVVEESLLLDYCAQHPQLASGIF